MRILSVSAQRPDSTGSGGYLRELVRSFSLLGHRQAVIAGLNTGDRAVFEKDIAFYPVYFNSAALPFPVVGMSDEMPYESTRYSNMDEAMTGAFLRAFRETLFTVVKQFRPDVILCHHLYLLTALTRRSFPNLPVWGICHGSDLRQLASNPLHRDFIRSAISDLDRICCLHETQKRNVIESYSIDPARIRTVGSGYNGDIFFDRGERRPHTDRWLVFAGKISVKKGVESLISALELLPWEREAFSLRLCGGWGCESQRNQIVRMAESSGRDIRFLGNLTQEQLAREFNIGDVFILPSFYEGLPLVLAEAMACGMRVVCTDLPGIRAWMDENVPRHGIRFVTPPAMLDIDTPDPQSLPVFHASLSKAILDVCAAAYTAPDLSALSWRTVCERILAD